MCGITGIISRKDPIDQTRFHAMHESLAHRGPDDSGYWIAPDERAALGHKRLSIIDLSDGGHQPMISKNGRYILVYNGEIYNYLELRKDLEEEGTNFHTHSDTEVLLQLWQKEGVLCLMKMRGMFAFAVWDAEERKLFLARDPLGIKPIYYCTHQNNISFASEIKALKAGGVIYSLDLEAIGAYLYWGSIPAPLTLYRESASLMPGQWIEWEQDTGNITKQTYWSYDRQFIDGEGDFVRDYKEAVNLMHQTLIESVRAHLVSDVPVGAFLSGGIDSTAIVSMMRQAGQEHIATFSIKCDDKELDESYYSELVSKRFNTQHYEWQISKNEFQSLKDQFMTSIDLPTIDGLNTWMVARLARKHDFKVVTSGIGGDEFFHGYWGTFRRLPFLMKSLGAIPNGFKKTAASTLNFTCIKKIWPQKTVKAMMLLDMPTELENGYLVYRQLFSMKEILELIRDKDLAHEIISVNMLDFLPKISRDVTEQQKISILETSRYLGSQLLPDSDCFSMAHAVELRTPLVDRILAEKLSRIDPELFNNQKNTPKALLVEAVRDIPDEVVHRKKQGFTLPLGKWIKGEIWEPRSSFLNEDTCRKMDSAFRAGKVHWSRRWGLEVLDYVLTGFFNV